MPLEQTIIDEVLGGLTPEQADELLQRDPLGFLQKLPCADDVHLRLKDETRREGLNPEHAELIVQDLTRLTREFATGCLLEKSQVTQADLPPAAMTSLRGAIASLRTSILDLVGRFGDSLSREAMRIHAFNNNVTYDENRVNNPATYGNFAHLLAKRMGLIHDRQQTRSVIDKMGKSSIGGIIGGTTGLMRKILNGGGEMQQQEQRTIIALRTMWQKPEVRMAHSRAQHLKYIRDLHEGRAILEGPSTVTLLNEIHANTYGASATKTAGAALVGPPGWGKTSVLEDYFRSHGIQPLSIVIDPGQSSWTLIAKPTLGLEKGIESRQALLQTIKDFSADQVKEFCEAQSAYADSCGVTREELDTINNDGILDGIKGRISKTLHAEFHNDLARILRAQVEMHGYEPGPILKALMADQPVIMNEFPELQDWAFLNELLLAIPASDEEAASRPSITPKEGEPIPRPKGWYFDTITRQWHRVGKNFRICVTGNIGVEHGNTGAKPAFMSRYRDRIIGVEGMPPKEEAECVVWPHLSGSDGRFYLEDETAYRVHHLVTDVLPRITTMLRKNYRGRPESHLLSHREVIAICHAMNPEHTEKPMTLDDALMEKIIKPIKAENLNDALQQILVILIGTGYLQTCSEALQTLVPDLSSNRLAQMIREVKQPFATQVYADDADRYEGRCIVCGVKRCPCHGNESKSFVEHLEMTASLAVLGLSEPLVQRIEERMTEMAIAKQWPMYLETALTANQSASGTLHKGQIEELQKYLRGLNKLCKTNPVENVATAVPVIAAGVEQLVLGRKEVTCLTEVQSYLIAQLQDAGRRFQEERGRSIKKLPVGAQAILDQEIIPQLRLLRDTQSMNSKSNLTADDTEVIRSLVKYMNKVEALAIVQSLRYEGGLSLKEDITFAISKHNAVLREELITARESVFSGNAATTRTKKRIPAEVLGMPEFEHNYSALAQALQLGKQMLDLQLATPEELMEFVGAAERQMEDATNEGKMPENITPYVRVVKSLAELKNIGLKDMIEKLRKQAKIEPLPPLKNF